MRWLPGDRVPAAVLYAVAVVLLALSLAVLVLLRVVERRGEIRAA